ncbi:MAG: hypothetical protein ABFC90_06050 [Bacteroidales bacterium]|nr:hypothetical protein [Bacteroidales bacterium]
MKTLRSHLFFLLLLFPAFLLAQEEDNNGYLFPDFMQGTVLFKNGGVEPAMLNYNYITRLMLLKNDKGQMLEFSDLSSIVAIDIDNRVFIKGKNNAFFEQVSAGNGYYYIQWFGKIVSQEKAGAYGTYSSTSAVTTYSTINADNKVIQLKLGERVKTEKNCKFYLKVNDSFKNFDSARTLGKLFKGHEAEIEKFVAEQKIDFSKASDIERMVVFCEKFAN